MAPDKAVHEGVGGCRGAALTTQRPDQSPQGQEPCPALAPRPMGPAPQAPPPAWVSPSRLPRPLPGRGRHTPPPPVDTWQYPRTHLSPSRQPRCLSSPGSASSPCTSPTRRATASPREPQEPLPPSPCPGPDPQEPTTTHLAAHCQQGRPHLPTPGKRPVALHSPAALWAPPTAQPDPCTVHTALQSAACGSAAHTGKGSWNRLSCVSLFKTKTVSSGWCRQTVRSHQYRKKTLPPPPPPPK